MISSEKATSLMQLILSSKEVITMLEQAVRVSDKKKIEKLKRDLKELNENIDSILGD